MVPLSALWLAIVLSAVIVFVASSIMHMLLPYHRSDYQQLPDEDKVMATLRGLNLKRGLYVFPFCTHKDMKSPAVQEKYKQGPVGFLNIMPPGPPTMPKFLGLWFAFQLWEGGFSILQPQAGGGVAFFAHIGGFAFGLATARLVATRRPLPPRW